MRIAANPLPHSPLSAQPLNAWAAGGRVGGWAGWVWQVLGLPLALVERLAWDTALFLAAYGAYALLYGPPSQG